MAEIITLKEFLISKGLYETAKKEFLTQYPFLNFEEDVSRADSLSCLFNWERSSQKNQFWAELNIEFRSFGIYKEKYINLEKGTKILVYGQEVEIEKIILKHPIVVPTQEYTRDWITPNEIQKVRDGMD